MTEPEDAPDDRLDSWKEIAAYLKRDVTTVQRWEKREGMPVNRHLHQKMGSVYAFKAELDAWSRSRGPVLAAEPEVEPAVLPDRPRRSVLWVAAATGALLIAVFAWVLARPGTPRDNPLADARFLPLTGFDGIEQAATISRDGRFVAFLSDHDGPMDVWVTQVGVDQFYNLTHGTARELVNTSARTLGFSPDGTLATFWERRTGEADRATTAVWAVPVLGGQPRPYLEGAVELDWSADGQRLVYHTSGAGDPMYVRDAPGSEARHIFSAPAGLHGHFLTWSPDGAFIYFVQGTVPDRMDLWRIRPDRGSAERLTHHDSVVSHPVFLDSRTLLYLACDPDGSGPWIFSLDLRRRVPRRVSVGPERYTSLAASADGRRVAATLANLKGALWRVPIRGGRASFSDARRIPLSTGNGSSPRFGGGHLLYVSSQATGDGLWKRHGETASEVWSAPDARIVGAPAVSRDGRIAFSSRRSGRTALWVANLDGTGARQIGAGSPLEVEGAPSWTPDGRAVTVAVVTEEGPRLRTVPLDGSPPASLVSEYSVDPTWSPDGELLVYSGSDIGTTFEVKALKTDGSPLAMPRLTLTRGARHLSFLPGQRSLVVLRGELQHKDLWRIDLATGAEQPMTELPQDFVVRDFDVSPDGGEIVLEQVVQHSDIVLLEIPRR